MIIDFTQQNHLKLIKSPELLSVCFNLNMCEDTHRDWQQFLRMK